MSIHLNDIKPREIQCAHVSYSMDKDQPREVVDLVADLIMETVMC